MDALARKSLLTALLLSASAAGGAAAAWIGLPMPWMLGSLAATGTAVALFRGGALDGYVFPPQVRNLFVALIGVMIGTQVTPELFGQLAALPFTVAGLALFVVLAQGGNFLIFRHLGGYDRATAFFAGAPGGLMESILLGEGAGADVRLLTIQQFLRIILVITAIPLALSLWMGEAVGSAAGMVPRGADPVAARDLVFIAGAAAVGLLIGQRIHLPASQIIGPLLFAAALTLTGQVDLHLPYWLIAVAQVVIGMSLGLRFTGVTGRLIRRAAGLACLSVLYMLAVGTALSLVLVRITGQDLLQLIISFAPGGVTEMSLVALSLAADPALVSLHHVIRILMTVGALGASARMLGFTPRTSPRA